MKRAFTYTTALLLLSACQGVIGASNSDSDSDDPADIEQPGTTPGENPGTRCGRSVCSTDAALASATALPRLTHAQWENTMRDLLRLDANPGLSATFQRDTRVGLFDNNGEILRVGSELWNDYQSAAETLAQQVATNATAVQRIAPAPAGTIDEQARAFVQAFGRRAYRRPLNEEEINTHVALFMTGGSYYPELGPRDAGIRLVLEAFLQSPFVVYRTELGTDTSIERVTLTDHELASRLSYLLWNSTPDDELLDLADRGELSDTTTLANQAERLLNDPRGVGVIQRFHSQLLNWSVYRGIQKDPMQYPDAYAGMGNDMYEEARRFTDAVVFEENGDLEMLLTANFTYANTNLAQIYGAAGGDPTAEFTRLNFPAADQRGGILTQLGFLATNGGPTGAIHRGVYVNERILCTDLPPPPDELPPLPNNGVDKTTRELIDEHTGEGTCGATCHGEFINPVGFAFEHFDGLGRFRNEEAGLPIDAFASFDFDDGTVSYDGALEFAQSVSENIQTHDCYAAHWFEFALGRKIVSGDLMEIQAVGDGSAAGQSIKELILSLVNSETFRIRHNAQGESS